ncbi:hypothetical protein GCM10023346_43540 [Arthrobacter gyeryongensis]|uniref:HEPN AbiU2-like domain-containing protein n=1 Tax=Arthrobacter gyeryongensis TaxID=1650592 RepID=A0ABP9STG5_9MICC
MGNQQAESWKPRIELSALAKEYGRADLASRTRIETAPPRKWSELISRIDDEVANLLRHRATWHTFLEAAKRSPVAHAQPYFAQWVGELYASTAALGIRKMVDADSRTGSFTQLLTRLAEQPHRVTREWYIGGTQVAIALHLDQTFTRIADPHYQGHLEGAIPSADLAALREASKKVEKYVNEHVAHAQLRPTADLPSYGDVDAALDLHFDLLKKYLLLLTSSDRIEGPPIFQFPWTRVFYEPWLTAEPQRDLGGPDI